MSKFVLIGFSVTADRIGGLPSAPKLDKGDTFFYRSKNIGRVRAIAVSSPLQRITFGRYARVRGLAFDKTVITIKLLQHLDS